MKAPLRVLVVDDSMDDVELMLRELRRGGYEPLFERVETAAAMKMMLDAQEWDVVLADHSMPFFSSFGALTQLQLSGQDMPFIIVSGSIGEELAVSSMKAGAHDYIMKDNLTRLVPAIERELIEVEERRRRRLAEAALRKNEASLANAQRIAHLGNWEWDIGKNEVRWSDEVYRIFGLVPSACSTTYEAFLDFVHPADREFVRQSVRDALYEEKPYRIDYRIVLPGGFERVVQAQAEVVFDDTGRAIQMNGVVQDITERKQLERELRALNESLEQRVAERTSALMRVNEELQCEIEERKRIEERIRHMAFHDSLTALPNRILFNDRLTIALAHAQRMDEILAVLFLDLDRFKAVNDALGHTMGDQLLREVADRLKSCVREEDTVARFGGDEFTLLMVGITQVDHVTNIACKILNAFKRTWSISKHELYITASIGIAIYPNHGDSAEILLRNADAAMYCAKEQGKNTYQFYTAAMHAKSFDKMLLECNLHRALEREEFDVYYQPLVSINTGLVVGMEALVRWRHPERGLVLPDEFLALSENTRLIVFIDELVLYTVCKQCKVWQDEGHQPLSVAVNISVRTFQQPNLVEMVTSILQKTGLDPQFLGIEITESIAMQDMETTIGKLERLSSMGIQISIDDFGTGFSSLYYLKKFPIHKLKISQHFVSGIATDQNDKVIVSSVIALAQSLKFKVVAEGVENEEQLVFLKQRQCDEMQGYLFCKPLPADEFGKMEMRHNVLCDA
ncbi:MAG: EAL domain-containing protein [Candidatus Brocadia sp.]|nr:MAG: EAL domain-containing protein [Candidatus Brocadia sp.]